MTVRKNERPGDWAGCFGLELLTLLVFQKSISRARLFETGFRKGIEDSNFVMRIAT